VTLSSLSNTFCCLNYDTESEPKQGDKRGFLLKIWISTQVTGTFSSKGEFVLEIQVKFTPISAGHLAQEVVKPLKNSKRIFCNEN
jgi:hypothetical protein